MELQTSGFIQSAHQLPNYNGKCKNLHGHTWAYFVIVECDDNKLVNGMVFDFSLIKKLDHQNINDFIEMPTAENIYLYIKKMIYEFNPKVEIITIRVWEDIKSLIRIKDLEEGRGEYVGEN